MASLTRQIAMPAAPQSGLGAHGGADAKNPARQRSLGRIARAAPLLFFLAYLNLTVVIFAFGPWRWPIADGTLLYAFLGFAHVSLAAGYLSACFGEPAGYVGRFSPKQLIAASTALTLVLYVPTILWLTRGDVPNIEESIFDPGIAYRRFQEASSEAHETALISYVRALVAPLLALVMPLLPYYWERLSRVWKWLGMIAVVSNVTNFLFTGRNKGLADLAMLAPWFVAMRVYSGKLRLTPTNWIRAGVVSAALLGAFGFIMMRGALSRSTVEDTGEFVPVLGGMHSEEENILLKVTPVPIHAFVRSMTFNQTHGYYALYLSLDLPFETAFPVGHSYVLQTLEERITGSTSLADRSYTSRLHNSGIWHKGEFWHTTYTWFASDVSFPGVIVLLFFFGRLFAQSWLDTMRGDNPYAVAMFLTFVMMVYYFPTNNIVLGFPEGYTTFWGTLIAWLMTRSRSSRRRAMP